MFCIWWYFDLFVYFACFFGGTWPLSDPQTASSSNFRICAPAYVIIECYTVLVEISYPHITAWRHGPRALFTSARIGMYILKFHLMYLSFLQFERPSLHTFKASLKYQTIKNNIKITSFVIVFAYKKSILYAYFKCNKKYLFFFWASLPCFSPTPPVTFSRKPEKELVS